MLEGRRMRTFEEALEVLVQRIVAGESFEQLDGWIEELPLDEDERAALWFVLYGESNEPRRRNYVIFSRN